MGDITSNDDKNRTDAGGAEVTIGCACDGAVNWVIGRVGPRESYRFISILDWRTSGPRSGKLCVSMAFMKRIAFAANGPEIRDSRGQSGL
jgi:hypothetical protein